MHIQAGRGGGWGGGGGLLKGHFVLSDHDLHS